VQHLLGQQASRNLFPVAIVAAAMLGGTLTTAAQVSSGSTNAAQQNAAPSSKQGPNSGK
jgi:hypothetical protein